MSHDADALNRLIGRLRAAAKGYRAAGSDGVVGFKEVFDANAAAHDRTAELLGAQVRALGGHAAEDGGSDLAPQGWTGLGPALAQGARATMKAVERVEAELLAAFQEVADDVNTSGATRDAIVRACEGLKVRRDSALRQADALGA